MIHPFELSEEEGAGLDKIGSAFVAVSSLLGMEALWDKLETAPMPETARLMLFDQAAIALRGHMADLLRACGGAVSPDKVCTDLRAMVDDLANQAEQLLGLEARGQVDGIAAALAAEGAPAELAQAVARLFALDGTIGLALLARDTGIAPVVLARGFIDLGALLGIDWAQARAAMMSPADPWERLLVSGLARDFQQMRLQFLRRIVPATGTTSALVEQWAVGEAAGISQLRRVITRAQHAAPVTPAMLAQIASQARNLLTG
jgi:glutamate dehydrogenase